MENSSVVKYLQNLNDRIPLWGKVFFAYFILTVILTWPVFTNFGSEIPSWGPDTMQVVGVSGSQANVLEEKGILAGVIELAKRAEINFLTVYAIFYVIFGKIVGYNLLFYLSFILSGVGMFFLFDYFFKNKKAAFFAGVAFAFAPFHIHNAMSTNVGTMHQEWLPFFVLFLFRFFRDLKFKDFMGMSSFFLLIGITEHQLLAFTSIFIVLFALFQLVSDPKKYLRPKLWGYVIAATAVFSILFFFIFKNLFTIAFSDNNFLDPGLGSAVKYSNDVLSIFVPPSFHSFWPDSFSSLREQFERKSSSSFSVYTAYLVFALSLFSIAATTIHRKRESRETKKMLFFWIITALVFYVLSLGPHLHYKGVLDPPVKMPYNLIYENIPFFENIRTVGRIYIWSILALSLSAAWGLQKIIEYAEKKEGRVPLKEEGGAGTLEVKKPHIFGAIILVAAIFIVVIEYLPLPLSTITVAYSPLYDKLGEEQEEYSVLEVPGNTDYDFASRSLVWRSIHKKNTINGYDFARVNDGAFSMQKGTPVIRTLLYELPEGTNGDDRDIMKDSYYKLSNEILGYYKIKYVILDKEGLKGDPDKGEVNQFYGARTFLTTIIKCDNVFEDEYVFSCQVRPPENYEHMFVAMDFANQHWMGKGKAKNGLQRWGESGAGLKLVNMANYVQSAKLKLNVKVQKPLGFKLFFNGSEVLSKYVTEIDNRQSFSVDLPEIIPGDNSIIFGVYDAAGKEVFSEDKKDIVTFYELDIEN